MDTTGSLYRPMTSFGIKHLNPNLVQVIVKNSVRTAKRTRRVFIIKMNWLMPFTEIIGLFCESYETHVNIQLLNVEAWVHIITTGPYKSNNNENSRCTATFPYIKKHKTK
jgi:hypothetical protein